MTAELSVRVLGPLEVQRHGEPVRLEAAKPRALLALLLIRRGDVHRDVLVDALWGEGAPAGVRNTLQVYVSRLRRELGQDAIVTTSSGYRLSPLDVDADRFEALLAEGAFEEALSLWRGPAFGDLRYEAFAQAEAGRLDELRLACLEGRIAAELELGRHALLVGELEALVVEHPLRERPRAQLILALYRSGRQAEALAQYKATRHMLAQELGLEPGPELRKLERMILAHDPSLALPGESEKRSSLPVQPTPFIGREHELVGLVDLVRGGSRRIVTVTGPGGSGKTRLAIEAARALEEDYAGGVFWVALQSLQDPSLIVGTIAEAVDARGDLAARIGDKRMLLLVDNLEHLLAGVEQLGELVASCPNLLVLATSREHVHLAAEREYPVGPMTEPDAVALFRERSYRGGPDELISEICRKVDCLPLAIELAAASTRTLAPESVLERLGERLLSLGGGPRDSPARQRNLRATIEWTHDRLSGTEKTLFARLSVFHGGCTLDAAETVCSADADGMQVLVDSSLLSAMSSRFSFLEMIREFAVERLEQSAECAAIRDAHARWCLDLSAGFASDASAAATDAQAVRRWMDRIEEEANNCRAALRWTIARGETTLALELASNLGLFWTHARHGSEGADWFETALFAAPTGIPDPVRARALYFYSFGLFQAGRASEATVHLEDALRIFESVGDRQRCGQTMRGLGLVHLHTGDYESARRMFHKIIESNVDEAALIYRAKEGLGDAELLSRNPAAARPLFQDALAEARSLGHVRPIPDLLLGVADSFLMERQPDSAEASYREALALARDVGAEIIAGYCLAGLAATAALKDERDRADLLWGAVQRLEREGFRPVDRARYEVGALASADAQDRNEVQAGSQLSLAEAVTLALGPDDSEQEGRL
jgi:predicted ATPase/DNA-binding SARP family transcriptional activator